MHLFNGRFFLHHIVWADQTIFHHTAGPNVGSIANYRIINDASFVNDDAAHQHRITATRLRIHRTIAAQNAFFHRRFLRYGRVIAHGALCQLGAFYDGTGRKQRWRQRGLVAAKQLFPVGKDLQQYQ